MFREELEPLLRLLFKLRECHRSCDGGTANLVRLVQAVAQTGVVASDTGGTGVKKPAQVPVQLV